MEKTKGDFDKREVNSLTMSFCQGSALSNVANPWHFVTLLDLLLMTYTSNKHFTFMYLTKVMKGRLKGQLGDRQG